MDYKYLIGGLAFLGFGVWLVINQVKIFRRGNQDELGWDIKLLAGGIIFAMIGIYLLFHLTRNL
jgi:hypothetical protein